MLKVAFEREKVDQMVKIFIWETVFWVKRYKNSNYSKLQH